MQSVFVRAFSYTPKLRVDHPLSPDPLLVALKGTCSIPIGHPPNPSAFAGAAAEVSTFCHGAAHRLLPLPLQEFWFRVLLTDGRLHL